MSVFKVNSVFSAFIEKPPLWVICYKEYTHLSIEKKFPELPLAWHLQRIPLFMGLQPYVMLSLQIP